MSVEDDNVRIVTLGYEKWRDSKASDPSYWVSIMADQFRTSSAGGGKDRPGYFRPAVTRDDFLAFLRGIHQEWRMDLFDVLETIAQDDRLVVRIWCAWTHRRTGKSCAVEKLDYWRLKNGRVVEYFEVFDTVAMEEARRIDTSPVRANP